MDGGKSGQPIAAAERASLPRRLLRAAPAAGAALAALALLYVARLHGYALFHGQVELFWVIFASDLICFLLACYLIYRALIQTRRVKPYSVLARELEQAEVDLRRTAAELADSNAELEQFARVASHDLQAPLVTVTGYIQLLARRCKGKLDAEDCTFIDAALEGVARMQRMIQDILTYSRVGRQGRPFEQVACSAVLEAALDGLRGSIEECQATVSVSELPIVQGDSRQLLQLFQNLMGNALKFRRAETPAIRVHAEKSQAGAWLFSVSDNGIGFPPEASQRIFLMFERLHGVSEYPGCGMGLAICRKIVERHGGRIWAESDPGKGSTFFFTLPA